MSDTQNLFTTLLLIKRNAVFLIRRSGNALRFPNHYVSIGGMMSVGENAIDCIVKEAYQEAGIHVREADLQCLGASEFYAYYRHLIGINFYTHVWQGEPSVHALHKHDAAGWFALDALPSLVTPGTRAVLELFSNNCLHYIRHI